MALRRRFVDPRARRRAVLLVAPLFAFIVVAFLVPLGNMFLRSFYEPIVADGIPETARVLSDWEGGGLPPEEAWESIARELSLAQDERTLGPIAGRLNQVRSGLRATISRTGREVPESPAGTWRDELTAIDSAWVDPATWHAIALAADRFTLRHFLNAVDLRYSEDGTVARQPDERRIYVALMWRTLLVTLGVTIACLVLGYPVAMLLAHVSPKRANLLLVLVLMPFWTSLLVRTTSWIVLLQTQGVVNDLLVTAGIVADDARLSLIYNMTGTLVAMTHILLPFMVLPLYSVMRSIPPVYMSAAASMGATPWQAFRRVYWPQALPGVGAGSLLVFILAVGFYITPALVGGSTGQLISNMIAFHMQTSLNWGLAAALGALLLIGVVGLYFVYDRVAGADGVSLG